MNRKHLLALVLTLVAAFSFAGCGTDEKTSQDRQKQATDKKASARPGYDPKNDVEYNNYIKAQKLYDSPSTIIWCTTTWGNASAPLVTFPVAGKLTSSSTTLYTPDAPVYGDIKGDGSTALPFGVGSARSVDGMFHPNPPQYRYGFTPGGQYVDFFTMPTLCTTALTKFQRQTTKVSVSVDPTVAAAQTRAEKALKNGNKQQAEDILEQAVGGDS